jgi:hypothetical protein
MNRKDLLQKYVSEENYKKYLEIGVCDGKTFLALDCTRKIAIDPLFKISKWDKFKWAFKKPVNLNNVYYKMKSDDFFKSKKLIEKHSPFDLIFIDGLHTFEASLGDALNAIRNLSSDGTIIFHDCFPPHKAAAIPAGSYKDARDQNIKGWTGEWCGDVWKTIFYLKSKYGDSIEIFVLDADYGLGVLKMNNCELDLDIDISLFNRIKILSYEDLVADPENMINLKRKFMID